jgi:hypothetical protein
MESTDVRAPFTRADGPFVTPGGRRLPVRQLAESDIPALLEFHDYLSRRSKPLQLLGMADGSRESVSGLAGSGEFERSPVLAIMAGPTALVRGIGQYRASEGRAADSRFTIDASLDQDGTSREMLLRLADHARSAGVGELDVEATEDSAMRAGIEGSGFSYTCETGTGHCLVNIAPAR